MRTFIYWCKQCRRMYAPCNRKSNFRSHVLYWLDVDSPKPSRNQKVAARSWNGILKSN